MYHCPVSRKAEPQALCHRLQDTGPQKPSLSLPVSKEERVVQEIQDYCRRFGVELSVVVRALSNS
jgi:hypothetical protein